MKFPPTINDRDELIRKWSHITDLGQHISSWTSLAELCWLCEVAAHSHSICEIGTYHGRSAHVMVSANPSTHLEAVDNCENPEVENKFARNLADAYTQRRVKFFRGTSDVLRDNPTIYDLGWIDAGHLYDDVAKDIENLLPKMQSRSILCGHDYRQDNPNDGVNRAMHDAFGENVQTFESIWWIRTP